MFCIRHRLAGWQVSGQVWKGGGDFGEEVVVGLVVVEVEALASSAYGGVYAVEAELLDGAAGASDFAAEGVCASVHLGFDADEGTDETGEDVSVSRLVARAVKAMQGKAQTVVGAVISPASENSDTGRSIRKKKTSQKAG